MCASTDAQADLAMNGVVPEGCPGPAFFTDEARRRELKGAATITISRENGELVGKIWFLDGPGRGAREVRSPTCEAVAETLVLIAEVHERPASGPMPPSAVLLVPPPSPSAAAPAATAASSPASATPPLVASPLAEPAASPEPSARSPRPFSAGVGALADTAVVPGLALGGMIFGRYTPPVSRLPTRGWATISVGYLGGSVDVGGVHVSHRRWLARITAVPYAWLLGRETRLGFALAAAVARLGVKADVPAARDDARPMVDVGLGPRLLTLVGPASVELGVDWVIPISRRRFVLPEREEPVFRLPTAAFGAFLALGSR